MLSKFHMLIDAFLLLILFSYIFFLAVTVIISVVRCLYALIQDIINKTTWKHLSIEYKYSKAKIRKQAIIINLEAIKRKDKLYNDISEIAKKIYNNNNKEQALQLLLKDLTMHYINNKYKM